MLTDVLRRLKADKSASQTQLTPRANIIPPDTGIKSSSPGCVSLPVKEIKLLLALGVGAVLLLVVAAITIANIRDSRQTLESVSEIRELINEVQRTHNKTDNTQITVPRPEQVGNDGRLVRGDSVVEQINSKPGNLQQAPDGSRLFTPSPQLPAQAMANMKTVRSNDDLEADSSVTNAHALVNNNPPALIHTRLDDAYNAERMLLGQQLDRQAKWYRDSIIASAATAIVTSLAFLFVCSLIWSKLQGMREAPRNTSDSTFESTPPPPMTALPDSQGIAAIVEAARAAERATIARDIHDELGALLMAIKIDLKYSSKTTTLPRRAVDTQWPVMLDRVNAAMNAVARIAGRLKPSPVDEIGLWLAIETYVREFEEVTKIPCDLRIDVAGLRSRGEAAREIFRVLQESLTNVARHAEASTVNINVGVESDRLKMEIADDGKGILPEQILDHHSLGVTGMFERIRRFDGDLHISGQPAGGTKVMLQVPAATLQ